MSDIPEGVEIRGKTLRIYFNLDGAKCREPLKLAPTPENVAYAGRLVQQIKHELRAGTFDYGRYFPESKRLEENTVGHYLDITLEIMAGKVADTTMRPRRYAAEKWLRPAWGKRQADSIDVIDIERWIANDLAPRLAGKTIRELLSIMRQVFRNYRARTRSTIDPLDGVTVAIADKDDPDPFTRAEIAAILETPTHCRSELNLAKFGIWTGPRFSEAIALSWDDVDLESGTVTWRRSKAYKSRYRVTKTRRSTRQVELLQPALEALRDQFELTGHLPPQEIEVVQRDNRTIRTEQVRWVWLRTTTGKPIADDERYRDAFWRQHLEAAGVRYRGPGNMRHTFASQMLTIEMPESWIIDQLGHTTTDMLRQRYAKWIRADAANMATRANRLLGF